MNGFLFSDRDYKRCFYIVKKVFREKNEIICGEIINGDYCIYRSFIIKIFLKLQHLPHSNFYLFWFLHYNYQYSQNLKIHFLFLNGKKDKNHIT